MALTDALPDMERELRFFRRVSRPKTLTPAQVKQFNEKGYIFPLQTMRWDGV